MLDVCASASIVPMTPDGSVAWNSYEIQSRGEVYLADIDEAERVIVAELLLMDKKILNFRGEEVDGGDEGRVYVFGGKYALKAFADTPVPEKPTNTAGDLSALRANTSLEEGLKRRGNVRVAGWKFRTPKYLGAVMWDTSQDVVPGPRWVMSYEPGVVPTPNLLQKIPTIDERADVYRDALGKFGLAESICLDDACTKNTIILATNKKNRQLVKIDVRARRSFDW